MMHSATELVRTMLLVNLPGLSSSAQAVVDKLITARGSFESADSLAASIGLRNRDQLSYVLHRNGLPQLQRLAGWVRIVLWLAEYETGGISLCRSSLDDARDPAFRYRLVRRLTKLEWTAVRARGLVWLVNEFTSNVVVPTCNDAAQRAAHG
jgi:hypothetical protein